MPPKFVKGNFHNSYLDMGVRKSQQTLLLLKDSIMKLVESSWSIPARGIWLDLTKEQIHLNDLESALKKLEDARKGALFVSLRDQSTNDTVFIRWYNSNPQTDLFSIEPSLTIVNNEFVDITPLSRVEEIEEVLQKYMIEKLDPEDMRPLSEGFLTSQKITNLIPKIKNQTRKHPQ